MRKLFVGAFLVLFGVCAYAQTQYSDSVLFAAFLRSDMKTWDKYLHAVSFDKASLSEKKRYLNYEYGYVATALDEKAPDAEQHLLDFGKHIDALEPSLPKATIMTYRSSYAAYEALANKWVFISKGLESFNLIKEAYEVDPKNLLVLTLKGNVDFYAPKSFGGDKKRALGYFRTARAMYEQKGDTINNWNYVSCRLCIIQCEDKLGNTDVAIKEAQALLKKYPNYVFLRDEQLPQMLKKKKK